MDFKSLREAKAPLIFLFAGLFLSGVTEIKAQFSQNADTIVTTNQIDTVSFQQEETIRDIFPAEEKEEKIHSPHKATFYSAIFPGLGQIYNKKYWKLPIVYGAIGGLGYAIHFNSTNYVKYKNAYRDFLIRDPGNRSYLKVLPVNLTAEDVETPGVLADWFEQALENKREYYKRYRDLSYIGMAAIYVLNMIDATVDAHFYNFDVSDDLSMKVQPVIMDYNPVTGNTIGIQMALSF
jgi:hypothetical protein